MSEMIERVALAIATRIHMTALTFNLREINQEDKLQNWLALYPIKVTDGDRALARAAIEAMREPTEAMADAGTTETNSEEDAIECWNAMINAAIREKVDA